MFFLLNRKKVSHLLRLEGMSSELRTLFCMLPMQASDVFHHPRRLTSGLDDEFP